MTPPVRAHRASAQRRRAALLDAAAELAAEVGAGAVTHRAVAARAGVPLSTTSYFFSSIDELVTEALRRSGQSRVGDYDAAERIFVMNEAGSMRETVDEVVDQIMQTPEIVEGGQVEAYLASGRRPELRDDVSARVNRFATRTEWQLQRMGAVRAEDVSWALQALTDGAMLHRLAKVETDHRSRLASGLRSLLAAAMLTDDEVDDLLTRYGTRDTEAAAPVTAQEPVDATR